MCHEVRWGTHHVHPTVSRRISRNWGRVVSLQGRRPGIRLGLRGEGRIPRTVAVDTFCVAAPGHFRMTVAGLLMLQAVHGQFLSLPLEEAWGGAVFQLSTFCCKPCDETYGMLSPDDPATVQLMWPIKQKIS